MLIQSPRFGLLEIERREVIRFPEGIIGFPDDREYVLLRKNGRAAIGWLHSTTNPALAFPVISLDALAIEPKYFESITKAWHHPSGVDGVESELAVMAIVCAIANGPPTVNLLAPVVVDAVTRTGAQIFLLDTQYTTMEPFPRYARITSTARASNVSTADAQ